MKSIKVTILGRRYPLRVKESEVETTHKIARYVNERMKKYRDELPQQSLTTVMVMAAMSIAEEAIENDSGGEENMEIPEQIQQINSQLEEMLDELQEDDNSEQDPGEEDSSSEKVAKSPESKS